MTESVRTPAVAGMFYPGSERELSRAVDQLLLADEPTHVPIGCIVPHAGYVYSGGVAGHVLAHLEIPERVVLLGPNHTGAGRPVAVAPEAAWATPLGDVPIDDTLRDAALNHLPHAELDAAAHRREHSLEVQLPFLQARRPDVRMVPVSLIHLPLEDCLELGRALADIIETADGPVAVIASSDMTHFESDDAARKKDRLAIDAALNLDPGALYETVHREGISMCGVIPATVMLESARRLGAQTAHLIDYATSADASGDRSSVVGYAGICVPADR